LSRHACGEFDNSAPTRVVVDAARRPAVWLSVPLAYHQASHDALLVPSGASHFEHADLIAGRNTFQAGSSV